MNTMRVLLTTIAAYLLLFAAAACVTRSPQPDPVKARDAATPSAAEISDPAHKYIVVRNRALDPFTGEFVATYDRLWPHLPAFPIPGRAGWYEVEGIFDHDAKDRWLAYRSNPTRSLVEVVPLPRWYRWDPAERVIIFDNADGTEKWRFANPGERLQFGEEVRERNYYPHESESHGGKYYVGYTNAVIAINDKDGSEAWRMPGMCTGLLSRPEYLLAVLTTKQGEGRVLGLYALNHDTGATIFHVPLGKLGESHPHVWLHADAGLTRVVLTGITIVYGESKEVVKDILSTGVSTLVDGAGKVLLRADSALDEVCILPDGRRAASTRDGVTCWSADWRQLWHAPMTKHDSIERKLMALADGDVIVAEYWGIAASGVTVMRLDRLTGDRKWTAECEINDVPFHSKYRNQAYLELVGGRVVMCCQQSMSTLVEVLDVVTGRQIHRWPLTARFDD